LTAEVPDSVTSERIAAGQVVYTPRTLRGYDVAVLGVSNRWLWRCPTPRLLELYDRHVTGHHLEVGVGTGYFLDRCRWPTPTPRLVLADLNEHCLAATARRLSRYAPQTVRYNVFEPWPLPERRFASIGLNYVLHCLPGDLRAKAVVFDHLQAALAPGGVLFGATILGDGVPRSWAARRLMAAYNRRGIFSNTRDRLADLDAILRERFPSVQMDVIGCVARFVVRRE
jgi:SAM-dependent methyltransferase